jgi:hypothetical protein
MSKCDPRLRPNTHVTLGASRPESDAGVRRPRRRARFNVTKFAQMRSSGTTPRRPLRGDSPVVTNWAVAVCAAADTLEATRPKAHGGVRSGEGPVCARPKFGLQISLLSRQWG